jgi:hypothetical protein
MVGPRAFTRRRRLLTALAALAAGGAMLWLGRTAREGESASSEPGRGGSSQGALGRDGSPPSSGLPLPPSTGWEEAAETIVTDLHAILDGRPGTGAFVEASVSAAREDLARYPPAPERLRRMLLGNDRERTQALVALSAGPVPDDDLVRLALRSRRDGDDGVMRLLCAELVASLPPAQLSRHEDDVLGAFVGEQNPLVLALALPAIEQLDEGRLRALLRAQVEASPDPMLPVLVGLARDRLGPEALADVGILVHAPDAPRE